MQKLRVGIVWGGWMGHAHARAYRRVAHHWADLPLSPELVAVAETSPAAGDDFRRRHGDVEVYTDWHDLLADPSIGAVSVTAPNFLHSEIGVAVAEAGKHLWIEKPVGLTAVDALAAIAGETSAHATLDDAVASATALDAMVHSASSGKWVAVS